LLERAGGATSAIRGFLTGGYGGGWVAANGVAETPFVETAWDPDSMRVAGAVIGASILWAVGEEVCPLDELDRVVHWMAGESAGQCGPCVFGLPALSEDVHSLAARTPDPDRDARLARRLALVTGRGGCKHPDGVARLVDTGLNAFADEVSEHAAGRCSASSGLGERLPVPPARVAVLDERGRDFR
jgi:NADH:ubiquinone oxidoreductase subunit F (NADH-binding)